MMPIKCCKDCVAPKRHPGCHDHCPEYQKEKADHEARKAVADKKKLTDQGIYLQRAKAVAKAMRGRRLADRNYARGKMNNG